MLLAIPACGLCNSFYHASLECIYGSNNFFKDQKHKGLQAFPFVFCSIRVLPVHYVSSGFFLITKWVIMEIYAFVLLSL